MVTNKGAPAATGASAPEIKGVGIIDLAEEVGEPDPGANTGAKSQPVKRGESANACEGAK
jgi:hypothetical protein